MACNAWAKSDANPFWCARFFSELKNPKSWNLPKAVDVQVSAVFSDKTLTPDQRVHGLFEVLMKARIDQASPASKLFLQSVADDIDVQRSNYSRAANFIFSPYKGPHYNPIFNRTAVPEYLVGEKTELTSILTRFHEFEHAYDRNTNPGLWTAQVLTMSKELLMTLRTPFTAAAIYRAEGRAIGSQWEIASRIPENLRKAKLKDLERLHREVRDEKLAVQFQAVQKSLAKKVGLPEVNLAEDYFKLSSAKKRAVYDAFHKRFGEMNSAMGISLSRNEFERVLRSERFLKTLETPRMKQQINQIPILQLKLIEIAAESLKNASLGKEEFVTAMRPVHGYTFKSIAKNHYDPTKVFYVMMAATSLMTAKEVYQMRDDKTRAQDHVAFIMAPEIQLMMRLYLSLIDTKAADESMMGHTSFTMPSMMAAPGPTPKTR